MKTIPTKINKYNVYNTGNRLLGMGDEVTLPSFEASSETVSGAGVLGEFDWLSTMDRISRLLPGLSTFWKYVRIKLFPSQSKKRRTANHISLGSVVEG